MLAFQQFMQPALAVFGIGRETGQRGGECGFSFFGFYRFRKHGFGRCRFRQCEVAAGRAGGLREAGCDRFQKILVEQNNAGAARGDWKTMFVILDVQRAGIGIALQLQLAIRQRLAIGAAEERDENLAMQQGVWRIPVNIEKLRVMAAASEFQQVQPPGIIGAADAHMVGNDIDDQSHAVGAQSRHQPAQGRLAAEFRVDLAMVDNVVAMRRAGAGF